MITVTNAEHVLKVFFVVNQRFIFFFFINCFFLFVLLVSMISIALNAACTYWPGLNCSNVVFIGNGETADLLSGFVSSMPMSNHHLLHYLICLLLRRRTTTIKHLSLYGSSIIKEISASEERPNYHALLIKEEDNIKL